MYQFQVRPKVIGHTFFSQMKSRRYQAGASVLAMAIICLLMPFLSGCGVNYKNTGSNSQGSGGDPVLGEISCGTESLTGAQSKSCSVNLTAEAKLSTVVKLGSSNAALQVPAQVTIAMGMKSAEFNAVSSSVSKTLTVTITGTSKGVSKTDVITLFPASTAKLSNISCGADSLTGPTSTSCSVSLSDAATSAVAISLSSSNTALTVPSSVTVAQGATSTAFNVIASSVTSSQSVTLTASSGGVSQSDVIQLLAPGSTQHKVQLNWNAPRNSTAAIVGYKVYRTISGSSAYASLSSSLDKQTSYLDSTVQSGSTYNYVVTSVDDGGNESDYSNSTTVAIP
jgi:hypothetical protein